MRRWIAAFLCCWMILGIPTALATEPVSPEEPAADTQQDEAAAEDSPAAEVPAADETEDTGTQTDLSALKDMTAIQTMEVTVVLDENGRASVTEKLEMNIAGTLDELRFSFPQGAKKTQIEGYWTGTEKENGVQYKTVSSKTGFSGTQSFVLSYTMTGLVAGAEASQVLTLPLLSLQDYRIGKLTFTVVLPKEFAGQPRFSSGYYGSLVEDLILYNLGSSSIAGYVNEIMRDNDTLTMTLSLPEGYFAGNYRQSSLGTVLTVLAWLALLVAAGYWLMTLRNPPLHVQARTLPPDGVNPGDVPFLLAGGHADFNMLVSHWAVLGYLSIFVSKSGHVILRQKMPMGNERRSFERKLFDLLFAEDGICDGASLRYKRVGEKAMEVLPRYWSKRMFEKRSGSPLLVKLLCALACAMASVVAMDSVAPEKLHGLFLLVSFVAGIAMCYLMVQACGAWFLSDWLWTGVGIGCGLLLLIVGGMGGATGIMLPAVAVSVFLGWQTCHGGLRSPWGDEILGQTLGFRRFLLHATDQNVQQLLRRDPQYFYKILPYAQAMGQAKRFVTLFHDCRLEPCQWYESARSTPTTAASFYDHYADTLDMLDLSIRK